MYQKKLSVAKNFYSESKRSELVKKISDLMPFDLILSSIQEGESGIQIKALSYSERSIAQFLINLSDLKEITDVNLSQVASSIENSSVTTFTISAKVNNTKKGEKNKLRVSESLYKSKYGTGMEKRLFKIQRFFLGYIGYI